MKVSSGFKKSLLGTIIVSTLALCTPTSNKDNNLIAVNSPNLIENRLEIKEVNKTTSVSWKSVQDYDLFVRSNVKEFYASDINDMYKFYNIDKDIPQYGFKSKKSATNSLDWQGAVYIYKKDVDSIYFYSKCSEEFFNKYLEYINHNKITLEELTEKLHHEIKHEGAHNFYYNLGKELGEDYLFKVNPQDTSKIYQIQHFIIEEGVAEYMSYKGELPNSIKIRLKDNDLKDIIKKNNSYWFYPSLGFILVKPILDINFEKGIKELIRHPLEKKDLDDLLGYREKRIENLLKEKEN